MTVVLRCETSLFNSTFDNLTSTGNEAYFSLSIHFWIYRFGSYLLLNVVDDPALLALVFC
jgi:hypothetical protein